MKKITYLLAAALLFSCTTSIPVQITKPSPMNLHRFNKITVVPFEIETSRGIKSGNSVENLIKNLLGNMTTQNNDPLSYYITSKLTERLSNSGYFEVVNPAILGNNRAELANLVEAYISGYIEATDYTEDGYEEVKVETSIKSKDSEEDAPQEVKKVWYGINRTEVKINYQVIRANDYVVISSQTHSYTMESKGNSWSSIDSMETLHRKAIDKALVDMEKNLIPRKVTEYRRLMKDETKDSELKLADELVKNNQYAQALEIFEKNYAQTQNLAAGFNAAILAEVTGNIQAAIMKMQKLVDTTGDSKAIQELGRMERTLAEIQEMENR